MSIYDRVQFDKALSSQPTVLQKLVKKERLYSREEKTQVIEAVLKGDSISHVSRAMGIRHSNVVAWVKEYRTSGQIKGNSQLERHESALHSIVKENPQLGRIDICRRLQDEGIRVSAGVLSRFMKKSGYFRNSDGRLRRRLEAVRMVGSNECALPARCKR